MPQKKTSLEIALDAVKNNSATLYSVLRGRTETKVLEDTANSVHRGKLAADRPFSKTGFRRNLCWNKKTDYCHIAPQNARLSVHHPVSNTGFINPPSTSNSNFQFVEVYNQSKGLEKRVLLVDSELPMKISSGISAATFKSHSPQTEYGAWAENGFSFEPVNLPSRYEAGFLSSYGANIMSTDETICEKTDDFLKETVPAAELCLEIADCGRRYTGMNSEESCSVLEEHNCYTPRSANNSIEAIKFSEFESCGNNLLKSLPCSEKCIIDREENESCKSFSEREILFPFEDSCLQMDQRFNESRDCCRTNDLLMQTECNKIYQPDSDKTKSHKKSELEYLTQQMVVTGFTSESVLSSESENGTDDLICSRPFQSPRGSTESNRTELTSASRMYCESRGSFTNSETQTPTRQKENDLQDDVKTGSFPNSNSQVLDLRINKTRRHGNDHTQALDLTINTNTDRCIAVMKSLQNSDTSEGSFPIERNRALCSEGNAILNSEAVSTSWGVEPSRTVTDIRQISSSYWSKTVGNNACLKTGSSDVSDSNQDGPYRDESSLSNIKARSLSHERAIPSRQHNSIQHKRNEMLTPCLTDPEDSFLYGKLRSCNSNRRAEE